MIAIDGESRAWSKFIVEDTMLEGPPKSRMRSIQGEYLARKLGIKLCRLAPSFASITHSFFFCYQNRGRMGEWVCGVVESDIHRRHEWETVFIPKLAPKTCGKTICWTVLPNPESEAYMANSQLEVDYNSGPPAPFLTFYFPLLYSSPKICGPRLMIGCHFQNPG
jgi:hypothetical protein